MKKTRTAAIGVIILSIVAIIVIVVSLLNVRTAPVASDPTLANTNTALPTSTATITSTPDPCAPENIRATIMELDKVSRQFSDTFVLAQNTPAAQLSPTVSEMQAIRRSAEDFVIPSCLSTLKDYQLGFMNTAINVSLLLYSSFSGDPNQTLTQEQVNSVVTQVNQLMTEATDYSNKYTIEMASLLGITLTPSPSKTQAESTSVTVTATP